MREILQDINFDQVNLRHGMIYEVITKQDP